MSCNLLWQQKMKLEVAFQSLDCPGNPSDRPLNFKQSVTIVRLLDGYIPAFLTGTWCSVKVCSLTPVFNFSQKLLIGSNWVGYKKSFQTTDNVFGVYHTTYIEKINSLIIYFSTWFGISTVPQCIYHSLIDLYHIVMCTYNLKNYSSRKNKMCKNQPIFAMTKDHSMSCLLAIMDFDIRLWHVQIT